MKVETLKNYQSILLIFISSILYFFFAYFLERDQFYVLLTVYITLFFFYYNLLKKHQNNIPILVGLMLLFRFIFLFSIPNLSQDFYRFIWDGRMIFEGFNPYLSLPETFIQQANAPIHDASNLYDGMGQLNGSHYTNYPPLNQLCFLMAVVFANKSIFASVVVLRIIIILADIGILYFGQKLLKVLQLPVYLIFWYLLNPFIIIELTGNLHFESVMLFFLIWSLYLLQQQKWILSAVVLACSVSIKLIPLLFLPLFYQWFVQRNMITSLFKQSSMNGKTVKKNLSTLLSFLRKQESIQTLLKVPAFVGMTKLITFYSIVLGVTVLLFLPFASSTLIENYTDSVGLWFRNFEFNGSVYYIFREIGYLFRGYNEIAIVGKILPVLTILFLIGIAFFRKNKTPKELFTALLFGLSFYYFTTTTMHPWYLSTLVLLAVFTKYRFPIVWSLVIVLSYSAYANETYQENLWLIGLEYAVVYGFLMYELFFKRGKKFSKTF